MSSAKEPKLCPNCPLLPFFPIILAERMSYTREKEKLSSHKICLLLRAFAKERHVTARGCPYFSETETMESYLYAEAEGTR